MEYQFEDEDRWVKQDSSIENRCNNHDDISWDTYVKLLKYTAPNYKYKADILKIAR